MADKPTITGPQGAMIYLAESLAGVKNEQARTNELLRELIELARLGATSNFETQDDDEPDPIAELKGLLTPNPPNGGTPPK